MLFLEHIRPFEFRVSQPWNAPRGTTAALVYFFATEAGRVISINAAIVWSCAPSFLALRNALYAAS